MIATNHHTNGSETMRTQTVSLPICDVADYCEYLASEGWPVVRTRESADGSRTEITFAY